MSKQYTVIDAINLESTGSLVRTIQTHWKNQQNLRIGYQVEPNKRIYRFGYALTTQVTPGEYARATFNF